MENKELVTIIGQYCSSSRLGYFLELKGPFDRKSIDEVIQKSEPFPYTFSPEYLPGKGQATFLVNDEKQALELVEGLNGKLMRYGFIIKYQS